MTKLLDRYLGLLLTREGVLLGLLLTREGVLLGLL
jgi:hypothetical protein